MFQYLSMEERLFMVRLFFAQYHSPPAAGFAQSGEGTALLIARGANPNIQNHLGLTARQEARGEAMAVYSITEKSARPLTELIKKYPSVATVSTVAGAGIHDAFRDPLVSSAMPSSPAIFKSPVVAANPNPNAIVNDHHSGDHIHTAEQNNHMNLNSYKSSNGPTDPPEYNMNHDTGYPHENTFPEDRMMGGHPLDFVPVENENDNVDDTVPPLGHIYVEKGEKSLGFFVRCTTRKHVTAQFQMLVDDMHNMSLNWPFVECDMYFLDPGGMASVFKYLT